jgi:Rrf2 family iron-responsive transcriptional regulator
MRLTQQTSYSIQTLMYCAVNTEGPSRIRDIARAYRISELHLFKIMHVLVENRLIETLRGRNGGIRLGRPANEITLGDVVRATEGTLQLNDCLADHAHECPIGSNCGLGGALQQAIAAFFAALDRFTIADVVSGRVPARVFAPAGAVEPEGGQVPGLPQPA